MVKKAFALALLCPVLVSAACTGTWTGATNMNWSNAGNWTGTVPGVGGMASTDTACFPTTVTGMSTINVDINPGLSSITLDSTVTTYLFNTTTATSIYLNTTTPSITVNSGSQTFLEPFLVANGSTLTLNVATGTNYDLNIEQSVTPNPGSGSYNVNFPGPGLFEFVWNGQNGLAQSFFSLGPMVSSGNLTATGGHFLVQNEISPSSASLSHGTTLNNINALMLSGGSLSVSNSVNVTLAAVGPSISYGAGLTNTQSLTVNNGAFSVSNSGMTAGNGVYQDIGSYVNIGAFTLNNGNATFLNSGTVQNVNGLGTVFSVTATPITMTGGMLAFQNTGVISNGGQGNAVTWLGWTLSGGSASLINMPTGSIAGGATGTSSGNNIIFAQPLTMSGGSLSLINQGPVMGSITTNGIGNSLVAGNFMLTGGSVLVQNTTSTATVSGVGATGSYFETAETTISNSSITVSNDSGAVVTDSIGAKFFHDDLTLNSGGTLTITNSANVNSVSASSVGAGVITSVQMIMNDGTCLITNSGPVSASSMASLQTSGAALDVSNPLTINGGTMTLQNTGTVGTNSNGAFLFAEQTLTLNGGSLFNLAGPASGGGIGGLVQVAMEFDVNGGLFVNNGTTDTPILNIASGGTVGGNGIFTGIEVTNSGTLIAGSSSIGGAPGTMTIDGDYTQTSTGILVINLGSPGSQLAITGTADLAGTLETALSGNTLLPSYIILTANGGRTGQFTNRISTFGLLPTVQYFPTYVLLTFAVPSIQYPNYFEPLFSSINHINLRLDRQMAQLRSRFAEEYSGEIALLTENVAAISPQAAEKQEQLTERLGEDRPWNFYFGPTGDVGRVLSSKDAVGFHYDTVGAQAGFDYAYSHFGIGFLADYTHLDGRGVHHWGKFDINQAHGSLYATYIRQAEKKLAFNLILGGGYDWYNICRNTTTGVARGTPQGVEFDALAGMEYTIEDCNWQIVPQLEAQYIYLHVNNYKEKGAGIFNGEFHSQNGRSLRSLLGSRFNYTWRWTNFSFKPELNLGWQWEFFDKSRHLGVSILGLKDRLWMKQPGRNVALAGFDLLFTLFDKYGIEASYDFEWNTRYMDHFFYLGANFRF